jgi:hypothetical protein
MDISKLKDQGLLIKTKLGSLAVNPLLQGSKIPADVTGCDFILSSRPELETEKFGDNKRLFSWPGEYEIKGIAIHAKPIDVYTNDEKSSLLFVIYSEDEKICYIPEIKKELTSDLIEGIGDVDLLIFPVKGDMKIWESTVEEIEPKAILPLTVAEDGFSVDAFLAKIGLVKPAEQEKLSIKSKSDLPSEQMSVFLLA